jgi:hypothetical protein
MLQQQQNTPIIMQYPILLIDDDGDALLFRLLVAELLLVFPSGDFAMVAVSQIRQEFCTSNDIWLTGPYSSKR